MQMMNAKQFALTLISLTVVFIVFSSSVFYNSIEGPLAAACLILLVLVSKDILTYAREVKMIFFIHLLFACSVLSTGISLYTRQQVSLTEAISDASSIVMVSFLGLVVYAAFQNSIVRKYLNFLILLFSIALFIYCLCHHGNRVTDFQNRYVLNVGLLLCILTLSVNIRQQLTTWKEIAFVTSLNSFSLYIVFSATQSRAMTISLGVAWFLIVLTKKTMLINKLSCIIGAIIFSFCIQNLTSFGTQNLHRYAALYALIESQVSPILQVDFKKPIISKSINDRNSTQITTLGDGVDVSQINSEKQTSTVKPNMRRLESEEMIVKDMSEKTDRSIGPRYAMLVLGLKSIKEASLIGHGNLAESSLLRDNFRGAHPHVHNQYLSLLLAGGILHLLVGFLFIIAPFHMLHDTTRKTHYREILPLCAFLFCVLFFESLLQLSGWRNLLIIYSYVIAGLLHVKPDLR